MTCKLNEVIEFNPSEHLPRGTIAKKVAMEHLQPFTRGIFGYEVASFNGGSKFRNGDTLMARITPCLENGKTAQVNILDDDEIGFGSTEFIVMREKPGISDRDFIYYLTQSSIIRDKAIKSMVGSSGRQRVQQGVLNDIEYWVPPLPEQRAIAATLSCLDDKIELNNKINANLEAQAQAIFKSWFVDFEPFRDGEFIESELGQIPKGWALKSLYEFAEYINGAAFKKHEYSTSQKGLPIVKIAELKNGITASTQYCCVEKEDKYYIDNGDILFSWSGNPETSIDTFLWHEGKAILNQHTFRVLSEEGAYSFVYCLLRHSKPLFTRIASNKQTTGLGHVTVKDLKTNLFPCSTNVVKQFNQLANPIIQQIYFNLRQNLALAALRDTLLHKLMSGEIEVPI